MIKCPKCGSENVEITSGTDNRKQPKWWFWTKIGILAATVLSLILAIIIKHFIPASIFILGFFTILATGKIQNDNAKEKKDVIHTKAVCKNCGHIEYLD